MRDRKAYIVASDSYYSFDINSVPEYFNLDGINLSVENKWVLAAKNIRTILK